MKNQKQEKMARQAKSVAGAVGIVLTYFGVFALLMYPAFTAAGPLA